MERVTIDLELDKNCTIQIYGEYQPEEKPEPEAHGYPGCPSELDIVGISFLKGGLMEYTTFCNNYMGSVVDNLYKAVKKGNRTFSYEDTIWEHLTNLALEKYESIK